MADESKTPAGSSSAEPADLEERVQALEAGLEEKKGQAKVTRGVAICGAIAGFLALIGPTLSGLADVWEVDAQQEAGEHDRTVGNYKDLIEVYAAQGDVEGKQQAYERYRRYLETCLALRIDQDRILELASREIDEDITRGPLTEKQKELAVLLEGTEGMPGLDSQDYFLRGTAYFEIREFERALEALGEAVRLDPRNEPARAALEKLEELVE